jgi:Asp-tRNA(Asn)/Glu-tRNA(Gln) amidotransferase A subunit family amidase
MTRDVRDLEMLLAVISGPDAADAHSVGVPPFLPGDARPAAVRGLRIGWLPRFGGATVHPEVAALTEQAVQAIARDGAIVVDTHEPEFADVFATYVVIATTAHATPRPTCCMPSIDAPRCSA